MHGVFPTTSQFKTTTSLKARSISHSYSREVLISLCKYLNSTPAQQNLRGMCYKISILPPTPHASTNHSSPSPSDLITIKAKNLKEHPAIQLFTQARLAHLVSHCSTTLRSIHHNCKSIPHSPRNPNPSQTRIPTTRPQPTFTKQRQPASTSTARTPHDQNRVASSQACGQRTVSSTPRSTLLVFAETTKTVITTSKARAQRSYLCRRLRSSLRDCAGDVRLALVLWVVRRMGLGRQLANVEGAVQRLAMGFG